MTKTNAISQIQAIKTRSLNSEQKELAIKIIESADQKDVDQLYQFIASRMKLGFNFDFNPEKHSKTIALLKEVPEKHINIQPAPHYHTNWLIIGENFDALKNLRMLKREINKSFQVIYIDPPYNTKTYSIEDNNASYQDLQTCKKPIHPIRLTRNHWLNMMNKRLRIAKDLLSEDGIIFVSIDDSEMAYLKALMDEIFSEENFICNFSWINSTGSNDSIHLQNISEYVICFAKNIELVKFSQNNLDTKDNKAYKFSDIHEKTRGRYQIVQLDHLSTKWNKELDYEFEHNGIKYYPGSNLNQWEQRKSQKQEGKNWNWKWPYKKLQWAVKNDFIVFKKNKIYFKQYKFVNSDNEPIPKTKYYSNLIMNGENDLTLVQNLSATDELRSLFNNKKVFDHPKPSNLIKFLINLHPNKNAEILDFFAGSGTTGHAVLDLNNDDSGQRKFTLITNNVNNIADKVTYERLFRIIQGKGTKGESFSWLKEHDPYYNQKLKVFEIEYLDFLLKNSNYKILEKITTLIQQNSLSINLNRLKINEQKLFCELNALKPLKNYGENKNNEIK